MSLAYNRRVRRILMRSRKIDINRMDQFDEQLKSKDNQLSLVELILSHKLFSENELLALISIDTEIPAIQLENVTPDTDLFALIDKPTATKFQVFPISKIKNILTVAVVDPFDHSQKENLEIITSCKVIFVLSTEHSIKKAIANKYVSVAKHMPSYFISCFTLRKRRRILVSTT